MTDSSGVVRARLDFSYDGTDFAGWAMQPRLRTVQGVMEAGLGRIVRGGEAPRLTVAGRTDAGVHARAQVAHVDIPSAAWATLPGRSDRTPEQALLVRLSGVLPPDVVVTGVSLAPDGFDARFSAIQRRYTYRLSDSPVTRDPLTRRHVTWHPRPVSIELLSMASASLVGLRNFTPFCRPRPGATTIRTLVEFSWRRETDGPDSGLVVATLRADAFCHSMVRSLVGAVIKVGEGRQDMDWLAEVASATARTSRISVAPPHGLTLEAVDYPSRDEMASQAEATRRRRSLDAMSSD